MNQKERKDKKSTKKDVRKRDKYLRWAIMRSFVFGIGICVQTAKYSRVKVTSLRMDACYL